MNQDLLKRSQVLHDATKLLNEVSESARLDAEILLAHLLKISRTQLLTHLEYLLTVDENQAYQKLISRCKNYEPIAYITGQKEFWSLPFKVTPATLIPRPESELLVELAINAFPADQAIQVADLGTGSGAIAIAIAHERPTWRIIATDISNEALTIASENAANLAIKNIDFRQGDWCDPLMDTKFSLILSNPPYLSRNELVLAPKELQFEPIHSLLAADKGMAALANVIVKAHDHLFTDGLCMVEHGKDQAIPTQKLFQIANYHAIHTYPDLSGIGRVTSGKR